MRVSEKTIELNRTRVVVEKCRRTHKQPAYSIGFTQDEEAHRWGADAAIDAAGWFGGFIQYKTLHREANGTCVWKLNRTKKKDQHSLLLGVEQGQLPVFYCFPKFETDAPLRRFAPPSLWSEVWWFKPSSLGINDDEHHEVELSAGGVWSVCSETPRRLPKRPDVPFSVVEKTFRSSKLDGVGDTLRGLIAMNPESKATAEGEELPAIYSDRLQGLNLLFVRFVPPDRG
jgi:hypothetical protein